MESNKLLKATIALRKKKEAKELKDKQQIESAVNALESSQVVIEKLPTIKHSRDRKKQEGYRLI